MIEIAYIAGFAYAAILFCKFCKNCFVRWSDNEQRKSDQASWDLLAERMGLPDGDAAKREVREAARRTIRKDEERAKRKGRGQAGASASEGHPADDPHSLMRVTGKYLNRKWKVGARHALYHQAGHWYDHLKRFPGALFDAHGYVVFETEEAYKQCSQLRHGKQLNVTGGVSSIFGYVKMVDGP